MDKQIHVLRFVMLQFSYIYSIDLQVDGVYDQVSSTEDKEGDQNLYVGTLLLSWLLPCMCVRHIS